MTIIRKLTIKPDPYQNTYGAKKIQKIIYKGVSYPITGVLTETTINLVESELVDLYIKFEDNRMKLDENNFYGQIIPEKIYLPGNDISTSNINNDDPELYQRVTFKMPNNNVTLNLKWVERIYTLNVDFPIWSAELCRYSITRDGGTLEGPFNGKLDCYTGDIVTLDIRLVNPFVIKPKNNKCYFKIDNSDKQFLNNTATSWNTWEKDGKYLNIIYFTFNSSNKGQTNIISSTIKKSNISIVLDCGFGIGSYFKKIDHNSGTRTFLLETGKYKILVAGAYGGSGGGIANSWSGDSYGGSGGGGGNGCEFEIRVFETTTMIYGLGERGGDGGGGGSWGSGGGGGTTFIKFDRSVKIANNISNSTGLNVGSEFKGFYCNGGSGGRGGGYSNTNGGGWGGGGGWKDTAGNGIKGDNGNGSNRGSGGGGGIGFNYSNNLNGVTNHIFTSGRPGVPSSTYGNVGGDGFIIFQYLNDNPNA